MIEERVPQPSGPAPEQAEPGDPGRPGPVGEKAVPAPRLSPRPLPPRPWPPAPPKQPPPPPPFEAAHYTFRLDSFDIAKTRSRDAWLSDETDTDHVSFTIAVGDQAPYTQTRDLGDLDEGNNYPIGLSTGPILIADPGEKVVFNYVMVNSGHQDDAGVHKALTQAGTTLAEAGVKAAGAAIGGTIGTTVLPGIGTLLGMLGGWLMGEVESILFADCDGPVAAEQVVKFGRDLWHDTVNGGVLNMSTYHPGIGSPGGCGSNSVYVVRWSITRS